MEMSCIFFAVVTELLNGIIQTRFGIKGLTNYIDITIN
jgi:hypothetical protein